MRISFVLGPAGSGKTFRCLSEIRDELLSAPEGSPLIFVAPKQSTYQLERQLLEGELAGYSRLHIVSFERLARFVFQQLAVPVPRFLSEQGRTMVLRAILTEAESGLSIFKGAARRMGFPEEVSKQIREFQNHGLNPSDVRKIATQLRSGHSAREKLQDLAFLHEQYSAWLAEQEVEDGDALLSAATEALRKTTSRPFAIAGLWFDGFAQLTPQELELLVEVLRFSHRGTLAFCVDPAVNASSKISSGFLVRKTVERCRAAVEQRYGKDAVRLKVLARDAARSRFAASPALRHLESCWHSGEAKDEDVGGRIRVVRANDPEGEVTFAAREILRHVRAGGRYREVALLLRDLQNDYPHLLRRVFRSYQIPYFLDHRESVAHHPLAELTRGMLRTVAFNWKHHDWFASLKSGLIRVPNEDLDELENEALARGWQGSVWRTGFTIPKDPICEERLNRLRERLMGPFLEFATAVGMRPKAEKLAEAIRGLWDALSVQEQLETWSQEDPTSAVHATVWDQMNVWLSDFDVAFRGKQMSLGEWLPIIESGLRTLTVGVVPPVLDQVLIGTVDRSRNPDLKVLYILGVNERVFPATPVSDTLLTEDDRNALCDTGCTIGDTPAWRMAGEQFYGYIACTRPRERLVLSYSRASLDGTQLNPSRFVSQVQRLFPQLKLEEFGVPTTVDQVVHPCECPALGIHLDADGTVPSLVVPATDESLEPAMARRLYGDELSISVSSVERFSACAYKFFLEQGLRVHERKEFLLDVREQGSFQHEVLSEFHEELKRENLRWRDLSPDEARARVTRIADVIIPRFRDGLLASTEGNRFTAENYKAGLQELMSVLVAWLKTNHFDPEAVELGFGGNNALPAWRLPLKNGRAVRLYGRVDRVDLHRISESEALCVVIDYKSGLKKPDRTLLHHGVQQQLPAYLLALTRMPEAAAQFQVKKVSGAGCFLLPLRAAVGTRKSRREALADAEAAKREGYTHEGVFDVQHLSLFDSAGPDEPSRQFRYKLTKDKVPYAKSFNALRTEDFAAILTRSEELIRDLGERVYQGDIAIRPYKHGKQTPCEHCDYQAVCRFDPWSQKYNVLRAPHKVEAPAE